MQGNITGKNLFVMSLFVFSVIKCTRKIRTELPVIYVTLSIKECVVDIQELKYGILSLTRKTSSLVQIVNKTLKPGLQP